MTGEKQKSRLFDSSSRTSYMNLTVIEIVRNIQNRTYINISTSMKFFTNLLLIYLHARFYAEYFYPLRLRRRKWKFLYSCRTIVFDVLKYIIFADFNTPYILKILADEYEYAPE